MSNFKKVTTDDWQYPVMKGYRMGCCDCGLVHNMEFEIVRVTDPKAPIENDEVVNDPQLRVRIKADRNNRSTAALRREDRKRKAKAANHEHLTTVSPAPSADAAQGRLPAAE